MTKLPILPFWGEKIVISETGRGRVKRTNMWDVICNRDILWKFYNFVIICKSTKFSKFSKFCKSCKNCRFCHIFETLRDRVKRTFSKKVLILETVRHRVKRMKIWDHKGKYNKIWDHKGLYNVLRTETTPKKILTFYTRSQNSYQEEFFYYMFSISDNGSV